MCIIAMVVEPILLELPEPRCWPTLNMGWVARLNKKEKGAEMSDECVVHRLCFLVYPQAQTRVHSCILVWAIEQFWYGVLGWPQPHLWFSRLVWEVLIISLSGNWEAQSGPQETTTSASGCSFTHLNHCFHPWKALSGDFHTSCNPGSLKGKG